MNKNAEKDRKSYFDNANLVEEAVFVDLYDYYAPKLLRHASFRLSNSEEARDVVSQVFLKTWQYLTIEGETKKIKNVKAFLYHLANNLIIDIYRQKGKNTLTLEGPEPQALFANYEGALHKEYQFDVEQAFKAANELKEEYRQVISLRYLDECSISEIAKILNRSKGSVSVVLFRAINELKRILKQKGYT